MQKIFFRHSLVWVLMALVFFAGIVTIILSSYDFFRSRGTDHAFFTDSQQINYPGIGVPQFQAHEVQNYIEAYITKKLRLRNLLIRINSQIYYSLFKKTFAEDGHIIVGKNQQLFEMSYIAAYCQKQVAVNDQARLIVWANKIKNINDFFESKGKTFIYLITPSKAEYMPEAIPQRFHCQNTGINHNIQEITKLLAERKVHYVDAASLMVAATKKYAIPMFPEGGIHWNWLGSSLGARAIMNAINQDKYVTLSPLHFTYTMEKVSHHDSADDDLLALVELLKPDLHYLVPVVNFSNETSQNPAVKVAIIGGSFNESLIDIFLKNKVFSKIDFYFYFKRKKEFTAYHKDPDIVDVTSGTSALDSILAADVVVLEENSSLIVSEHGKKFYDAIFTSPLVGEIDARSTTGGGKLNYFLN